MTDADLHPVSQVAFVPGLALFWRGVCGQDFGANSRFTQNALQASCDVPLLRVHGIDLYPAPVRQLPLHLFEQAPLLGVVGGLIQIRRIRDHEPLSLPGLRIERIAVQGAKAERTVRIEQQSVHCGADHRSVPVVLSKGLPDVGLEIRIRLLEIRVHLDRDHLFRVAGQRVRNVFEGHERRHVHEVLPEQEW